MFFNIYNNIFYNVNSNRKPTKRIVRLHFVETVVLAESGIGVDHREQDSRKIEHCDARGQLAHIRQHSPSCTMILLILRSPCTQPSLSGTRSRKRCRYRLSSSLTPVMFACAAAFCETKRCFVSLRLAAFLQPAQAVFISLYENSRLVDGCFIVFTLWGF